MISKLLRKLGVVKATLLITVISVAFSVFLYLMSGIVSGEIVVKGIIISIIIPAIIVPILSYQFLRVSLQIYLSERKLRESEQQFRELTELLPETIYEMDAKGNLTFVNRNAFDHFGYTQHDFDRGLNALDMLVPEDRKRALENVERILRGENPGLTEYTALRKDGTTFPAMFHSTAIIREEKPLGLRGFIIDITERKGAEEALVEKERFLRNIFDAIQDGISILDPHLNVIRINEWIQNMYEKELPFIGKKCYAVYQKRDNPCSWCPSLEAIETGETHSTIVPYPSEINRTGWIDLSAFPLMDAEGNVAGVIEYVKDITKQKQAEEALRESEKKYRDLFENVSDFIYVHDFEGKFLETNLPFIEEMKYSKDDLANLNVRDMIPERHKSQFEDYLKRIKENGKDEGLMKVMTKDGRERVVEYRNSLVDELSGPKGVQGSARDITERIQTEIVLRKSEEEYKKLYEESKRAEEVYSSILHTSADAIIIYDMEGKAKYISPAFTQLFGWTPEEVEGKRIPFLPESEKEATMAGIKEIVVNGKAIQGFETKRYTKDGRTIDVSISGSRYNDHEGKPAGMLVILRDRSEKKLLEAQLQRAQKMETIGTLAGGVAHDLNNILSGIVSYPDLLLMQLPEDSLLRRPILTIQESGNKAAAIVQDLLTMGRRGVAITEVVNLNDIISDYLKSPEYEKLKSFHPNVEVKIDLAEDVLNISGSTVHLTKSVMNLVSNAAEALPDGGKILITTENRNIDRPVRGYEEVDEGDYIILTVADTGVGISSEDIAMIFEPFYTKKKMGRSGTGLGMTVVWGTVKDHNGYIDIKSTEGKGTAFTLYFPATRQQSAKDRAGMSIEEYRGNGESVLVVDDVRVQRDIATGMLSELGYSVAAVSSGEKAVEYLKINTADLVILDMIMDPGIDGLETYKKILELHPGQKVIITSGFSETERVKEAQKMGAGQYIKKPYAMEKIGLAVRAELDQVGFSKPPKIEKNSAMINA